jgi:hypothetical protein
MRIKTQASPTSRRGLRPVLPPHPIPGECLCVGGKVREQDPVHIDAQAA